MNVNKSKLTTYQLLTSFNEKLFFAPLPGTCFEDTVVYSALELLLYPPLEPPILVADMFMKLITLILAPDIFLNLLRTTTKLIQVDKPLDSFTPLWHMLSSRLSECHADDDFFIIRYV